MALEGYNAYIEEAARQYAVSPRLIRSMIRQESGGKPNIMSSAGASGLMQLMPATAAEMGVSDTTDPRQNIMGGARYIRKMLDRQGGDLKLALASYNAGSGNVAKYGGIPPFEETQKYVDSIMAAMGGETAMFGNENTAKSSEMQSVYDLIGRTAASDQFDEQYPSYDIMPVAKDYLRQNEQLTNEIGQLQNAPTGGETTTADKIGSVLALLAVAAQAAKGNKTQTARIPGQVAAFTEGRASARKQKMAEARQKIADQIAFKEMLGGQRAKSFGILGQAMEAGNAQRSAAIKAKLDADESKRRQVESDADNALKTQQAAYYKQKAGQEIVEFNAKEAEFKERQKMRTAAAPILAQGGPTNATELTLLKVAYPESDWQLPEDRVRDIMAEAEKSIEPALAAYMKTLTESGVQPQQLDNGATETPEAAYLRVWSQGKEMMLQKYLATKAKTDPVFAMALSRSRERQLQLEQRVAGLRGDVQVGRGGFPERNMPITGEQPQESEFSPWNLLYTWPLVKKGLTKLTEH